MLARTLIAALFVLVFTTAARADSRDVVHDETNGTILRSTSGACVRTKWSSSYDECMTEVPTPQPVAVVPPPRSIAISREERTIYFSFNQASLSPEMQERLNTLTVKLKSERDVKGARIVGYADRIGNASYNAQLSKKRAEETRQYLIAKGLINTSVADTRWVGDTEPTASCSNKLKHTQLVECLQKDRRVEVEIDYFPTEQAVR